ncbi:MAG TPA: carboxypeptidase-like regulatory domain-containing protein [Chryseolinea sp.]|nr:carboxypeptidase-like regulatory domain-containing protein [Chryseolinea sp.]
MKHWKKLCFILFVVSLGSASAQRTTRGIVVDSITLKALPGVHVIIKRSGRGTVTNSLGVFTLSSSPMDTLVLSMVGYNTLELPLLFEEQDVLIRLNERIKMLKEITITGSRLYDKEIVRTPRNKPHALSQADAFSSPWTYLSRGEREKRKVVRLINENDRIRTYIQVIHDVELRESIMAAHELTEIEYYSTLARFNQQSADILYSTDPYAIETSLWAFFNRMHP